MHYTDAQVNGFDEHYDDLSRKCPTPLAFLDAIGYFAPHAPIREAVKTGARKWGFGHLVVYECPTREMLAPYRSPYYPGAGMQMRSTALLNGNS